MTSYNEELESRIEKYEEKVCELERDNEEKDSLIEEKDQTIQELVRYRDRYRQERKENIYKNAPVICAAAWVIILVTCAIIF